MFGGGIRSKIARDSGSIREAGILFPEKGWPVVGSIIGELMPLKSPFRIAVVGSKVLFVTL